MSSAPLNGQTQDLAPASIAPPKEPKSQFSQSEIATVTRLVCVNAHIDSDKGLVTYKNGWSDERILKMLQAQPGRGPLKLHTVAEFRRRELGYLPDERHGVARGGYGGGNTIKLLHKRIDDLQRHVVARLDALEQAITEPRR